MKTIGRSFAAFISMMLFSLLSFAQTSTNSNSVTSDSAAVNSGVATTFNSYGPEHFRTNQAAAASSAFATPAVIGTCATAGWGTSLQGVGAGLAFAGPGGVDPGCDLVRDLSVLKTIGASAEAAMQRACAKPEIRKAMMDSGSTQCMTVMERASVGSTNVPVASSDDPYIAARLARQGK